MLRTWSICLILVSLRIYPFIPELSYRYNIVAYVLNNDTATKRLAISAIGGVNIELPVQVIPVIWSSNF